MTYPARRILVSAFAAAAAFVGTSFAAEVPARNPSTASEESWLIVLEASRAEANGTRLVLSGLPEAVLAFADRPARKVLRPELGQIAALWNELFGDDSPNAAIVWLADGADVAGGARDQVIELWQPRKRGATLEFSYRVLPSAPERLSSIARGGTALPATMSKVALYIDGVDLNAGALQSGGIQCWPFHNSPTELFSHCAKTDPEMSCTCMTEKENWCGVACVVNCCRNPNLVDCETLCSLHPQVCIQNPDGT